MLKLVKRHGSSNFYLRGTVRGTSIDESTGIAIGNKRAAEEYRVIRERGLLEESIHGKRVTADFAQAADSYLKRGGRTTFRLKDIIKHFGTTKLSKIGQAEIDDGGVAVFPNMQASSRRTFYYSRVSAILKHAHSRGMCDDIKFDWPPMSAGVMRWLTKQEAHRLIDEGRHLRPLLMFLFYTGARAGEALTLDLQDLDLDRRHVQFIDTKNGTDRGVPLHPLVVQALRDMLSVHRPNGGMVFRRKDGTEYEFPEPPRSPADVIRSMFKEACKRAKIENFRIHDTRHTWATWHYQANRDLGALQKLGGWKTLAMVMRYAHTNVDELSATIERL